MDELRRLTPRSGVFERYVFDEEERHGSELLRQAPDGRLDVLDNVGVVVCSLQRRSKKILWHDSLLGLSSSGAYRRPQQLVPVLHVIPAVREADEGQHHSVGVSGSGRQSNLGRNSRLAQYARPSELRSTRSLASESANVTIRCGSGGEIAVRRGERRA